MRVVIQRRCMLRADQRLAAVAQSTSTWLFIGTIFGAMLVLVILFGRKRNVLGCNGRGVDPEEDRRRKDVVAADAARMADARTPPFQGYPI